MYKGRGSTAQLVWLVSWDKYVLVTYSCFFQSSLPKDLEHANSCEVLVCFIHFPVSVSWDRPCTLNSLPLWPFLQTKTVIDKIQKLVSSEGRFKNLREALKKWAWLFSSSQSCFQHDCSYEISSLWILYPQLWSSMCSLPWNVPDWPGLHRRRNTKLHWG